MGLIWKAVMSTVETVPPPPVEAATPAPTAVPTPPVPSPVQVKILKYPGKIALSPARQALWEVYCKIDEDKRHSTICILQEKFWKSAAERLKEKIHADRAGWWEAHTEEWRRQVYDRCLFYDITEAHLGVPDLMALLPFFLEEALEVDKKPSRKK